MKTGAGDGERGSVVRSQARAANEQPSLLASSVSAGTQMLCAIASGRTRSGGGTIMRSAHNKRDNSREATVWKGRRAQTAPGWRVSGVRHARPAFEPAGRMRRVRGRHRRSRSRLPVANARSVSESEIMVIAQDWSGRREWSSELREQKQELGR